MYQRLQHLKGIGRESCFLWGARQTGKSTLLKKLYPRALVYDLLLSDTFERIVRKPSLLREEILTQKGQIQGPVIVDEVQKVPPLLNDIQWLIVNHGIQFILSGSSARKLKRGGGNLLGGRALRYELYPLVSREIQQFNLLKALNHGLLPRHYLAEDADPMIRAYLGDYLREEIAEEALSRNIPAFARFLDAASFSNGEIVNYQNVASECGVSPHTVKEYFQILEDTLLAYSIPSFRKRPKRRVIHAPKFYFFDVGLANVLIKRGKIAYRGEAFGRAFEHFILQEIIAHRSYSGLHYPLAYWRTASQLEVDFILGDHEVVLEVKGVEQTGEQHLRGLRAFQEEYKTKKAIIVSLDPRPRLIHGIQVLPWAVFLEKLWTGDII